MKLAPVVLLTMFFGTVTGTDNKTNDPASLLKQEPGSERSLFWNLFRPSRQQRAACVDTEQALREKLAVGGTVIICRGATITLQAAIVLNEQSFDLRCQEGPLRLSLFRQRRSTSKCVLSGGNKVRIFDGSNIDASFQGIEFRNGKDTQEGGAIRLFGNVATFQDCLFSGNEAQFGGAIAAFTQSSVTIRDCVFDGNTATENGGAILVSLGVELFVSRTTMSANKASEDGSAMSILTSDALVEDCLIVNGITNGSDRAVVAALQMDASTVNLKRTVFSGNTVDILFSEFDNDSFVDCDATERVNFCNGKEGIVGDKVTNTNCPSSGDVDTNNRACARAAS